MTTREKLAAVLDGCYDVKLGYDTKKALDALEAIVQEAINGAIEECAKLVSLASVKHPSCIDGIGGLKWEQYNDTAQMMAHAVCQSLSIELRALKVSK